MAWSQPKIDWNALYDSEGVYIGDYFNVSDFNRIKNNLEYLRELAVDLYNDFAINSLGVDRTEKDYFYADEINELEENLNIINANTFRIDYGEAPVYVDNGAVIDFSELNRIESAILDIYGKLSNQSEGRRKFEFNFGIKEAF